MFINTFQASCYLQVKNSNFKNPTYKNSSNIYKFIYMRNYLTSDSPFVCPKVSNFQQHDCFPTYSFVQRLLLFPHAQQ